MCVPVCQKACKWPQRQEAVGSTGDGVTGSCEPPHVGVGFQLGSSSRAANTL